MFYHFLVFFPLFGVFGPILHRHQSRRWHLVCAVLAAIYVRRASNRDSSPVHSELEMHLWGSFISDIQDVGFFAEKFRVLGIQERDTFR